MDALHTQLSMINIPFDITGIIKIFLLMLICKVQRYSTYIQPSESSCGGCAIYVNSQSDHLVGNDLSALEEEYEIKAVTSCSTHKIDQQETDG